MEQEIQAMDRYKEKINSMTQGISQSMMDRIDNVEDLIW
jgi:hypothetical protein